MTGNFKLFATSNALALGQAIASELNMPLGPLYSTRFSDGEVFTRFEETIRGETVILVAQVNMPYEHLFELFVTIDAARRASAKEIICVVPYLPHSRQERKDSSRSAITSRLIADFIEHSGADRLITIDMHSTSIEGFFKIPIDHLHMSSLFIQDIRSHFNTDELCLCSPDFGGLKRIRTYKQALDCEMAVIHKERLVPNQVETMDLIGNPAGKHIVLVDDIIDTGGTLCKAAESLMERGAKSVTAYCTHGVLSGQALQNIAQSCLRELIVTNTLPHIPKHDRIRVISCHSLLARAIEKLMRNESLKEINLL